MSKILVRTLLPSDRLWHTEDEKEKIRKSLNDRGFYVLHGAEDTLLVYAIRQKTFLERWFLCL